MTPSPSQEAREYPPLPEWSKRDDLGGLVPSEIRQELRRYVDSDRKARQQEAQLEVRADGALVPTNRWEVGIRRIVALLWGNRHEFEVDDVVEAVGKLVTPFNGGDDEALVRDVLGRAAIAKGEQT